jgi:TonB family protein
MFGIARVTGMKLSLLILIVILVCSIASAQDVAGDCKAGNVIGKVTDMAGNGVPNAAITVESAVKRSTFHTDESGSLQVDLAPGAYKFTIQADGFKRLIVQDVEIKPQTRTSRVFPLEVGACSDCFWRVIKTGGPEQFYAYEDPAIKPPVITDKPDATYTSAALAHKFEGTITIEILLNSSGEIGRIRPEGSLPFGLTKTAISAASKVRFIPAAVNGQKVSVYYELEYKFSWRDVDRASLSQCSQ